MNLEGFNSTPQQLMIKLQTKVLSTSQIGTFGKNVRTSQEVWLPLLTAGNGERQKMVLRAGVGGH